MNYAGPGWELRTGLWQDVLQDETGDALITDPPFSEATHTGHNKLDLEELRRRPLDYAAWSFVEMHAFAVHWAERVAGWSAILGDHRSIDTYARAHAEVGRYVFHPIPCVVRGMTVRIQGDGPSSWAFYANVARPRSSRYATWGTLPGAYDTTPDRRRRVGGKPLALMRALIHDYTRPGDLVIDPCAGSGTTLLAAVLEGRRALGAELDPAVARDAAQELYHLQDRNWTR